MTKLPLRRLAVATTIILLTTTVFAMSANAASPEPGQGDPVPGAQDVNWRELSSVNHLYLTREDETTRFEFLDQTNNLGNLSPVRPEPKEVGGQSTLDIAQLDPYFVREGQITETFSNSQTTAKFQTEPLKRDVTIKGANVMEANIHVMAAPELNWTIKVIDCGGTGPNAPCQDPTVVGRDEFTPNQESNPIEGYRPNFTLSRTIPFTSKAQQEDGKNRYVFEEDHTIRVEVFANPGPEFDVGVIEGDLDTLIGTRFVWLLRRGGSPGEAPLEGASHLTLHNAEDAVEVTGWVTDHQDRVADILTNHTDDSEDDIGARYAIRSAFGFADVEDTTATFQLKRHDPVNGTNETVVMEPGSNTSVEMEEDAGLTLKSEGQKGWRLPEKYWRYNPEPAGQYQAIMSADNFRNLGGPSEGLDRRWDFRITNQDVEVEPFSAGDFGDTTTHLVQPGSSTTFLVEVVNAGDTEDTFDLSVLFPQAAQAGWTAEVRADGLEASNRLDLDPGEEALVRVTVEAPADAPLGNSQTFTLNATSTVDNEAFDEVTLIATTSNEVRQDVRIIGGQEGADVTLGPRDNGTATLRVWNNATVANDLKVGLRNDEATDWNVTLRGQGQIGDSFTVQGVRPGDVATVDVHFQTEGDPPADTNSVIFNATISGIPESLVELDVEGQVQLADSVRVEVLNAIEGKWRYLEMECPLGNIICPSDAGIPRALGGVATEEAIDTDVNDAVDSTLFRTWVTNTGDDQQEFNVRISDNRREKLINDVEPYRCNHAFKPIPQKVETPGVNPDDPVPDLPSADQLTEVSPAAQTCRAEANPQDPEPGDIQGPQVLRRKSDNSTSPIENPITLDAGETAEYYVKVEHRTDAASYAPSKFEFSVVAECLNCPAQGRDDVQVRGANGVEDESDVLVEPVARLPGYNDDAELPLVEADNSTQSTLSKDFLPGRTEKIDYRVRVTHGASYGDSNDEGKVTVSLTGIDKQSGWDAELKPLTSQADTGNLGFRNSYTFNNDCFGVESCPSMDSQGGADFQSYQDVEFLVRVHPPDTDGSEDSPLAGDSSSVIVQASSTGFGTDFVKLRTQVESVPELEIEAGSDVAKVTSGESTASLLTLSNVGSARGTFTFSARTPAGWSASPSNDNFTIEAQTNRSLPLRITAPGGVEAGQQVPVVVRASWADEVPEDWDREDLKCTDTGEKVVEDAPVECLLLSAEVVPKGTLKITPEQGTSTTIQPDGQQSFKFELKNTGDNRDIGVDLEVVASKDWTAQLSRTDFTGDGSLGPGETRSVNLIVKAPNDVVEGSSHAFVVKAKDTGNEDNVALETFSVGVVEGTPRPTVEVDRTDQLVERGSFTTYEIDVENRGSATDTFQLRVDGPSRDGWNARIEDRSGLPVEEARLHPNEQTTVFVNVTAPFDDVDPGTTVEPSFLAWDSSFQSKAEASLVARVQDYGVDLSMPETNIEYIPGTRKEIPLEVTNTGNGNDTLNVSMSLQGLDNTWTVTFDESEVRLEPGESETIKAELRSPRSPLPSARSVTFTSWAGTTRGAAVEEWDNRSVPFVVQILEYRSQDVDDDGFVELAVDTTPGIRGDGYPHYREIYPEGRNSTQRASFDADEDGKPDYLLDDPGEGGIDGVADVFWDPDDIVVYRIEHRPDVTYDDSPDYLVDSDGDEIIDVFWNSLNRTRGDVDAISLTGDRDIREYVMDSNGDGEFDKFYDPRSGVISQVDPAEGQGGNTVGLDTTGDGAVDTFYDTEDETVSAATFENAGQFAQDYWYLVILFGLVIAVAFVAFRRR